MARQKKNEHQIKAIDLTTWQGKKAEIRIEIFHYYSKVVKMESRRERNDDRKNTLLVSIQEFITLLERKKELHSNAPGAM